MDEDEVTETSGSPTKTVAETLSAERERQKLSLKQVAERTRLSVRHLASIENGDYSALPGSTYALGFTRSYARALGLDEHPLVEQLRSELDMEDHHSRNYAGDDYNPADPGRIPPKFFTWGAIAVLLLLLIAYLLFGRSYDSAEIPVAPVPVVEPADSSPPNADEADAPAGPVVLTANEDVWLRVYERDGDRLFESQLSDGESYTVPEDANEPLILTGRPQSLDVTVGGRAVPPLGRADYTVSDLPIDAESLLARSEDGEAADAPGSNGAASAE